MLEKRRAIDLGKTRFDGAHGLHHFCYGRYQSPQRMNWGDLRVFNRVRLEPGAQRDPNMLGGIEVVILVEAGEVDIQCGDRKTRIAAGGFAVLAMGLGGDYGIFNAANGVSEIVEIWFSMAAGDLPEMSAAMLPLETAVIAAHPCEDPARLSLRSRARISLLRLADGENLRWRSQTDYGYFNVLTGRASIAGLRCGPGDAIAFHHEAQALIAANEACTLLAIECSGPPTAEPLEGDAPAPISASLLSVE